MTLPQVRRAYAVRRIAAAVVAGGLLAALTLAGAGAARATSQPATWNFRQADVAAAQPLGHDGAGVTVAVVDTWVDPQHPDFGGRVVDEVYCVGGSCRAHSYAPDKCSHGTHVAGTVASSHYGVAPRARILAVQVLTYDPRSGDCSGSGTDIAAGIRYAATHGARVINLSVGDLVPFVFQDSDVTEAIRSAAAAGVVVAVAAGNQGLPLTDSYGQDVLVVAATGPSGELASYSDYGGSVSIAAPGGDADASCTAQTCILSTIPHGGYGLLQGTSMATPHIAGTAALLLGQAPGRGAANVVETLEATARPLSGAGHGLLDAAAALRLHAPSGSMPAATTTSRSGGVAQQPAGRRDAATTTAGAPTTTGGGSAPQAPAPARAPTAPATSQPSTAAPAATSDGTSTTGPTGTTSPPLAAQPATNQAGGGPGAIAIAVAVAVAALVGAALLLARRGARPRP